MKKAHSKALRANVLRPGVRYPAKTRGKARYKPILAIILVLVLVMSSVGLTRLNEVSDLFNGILHNGVKSSEPAPDPLAAPPQPTTMATQYINAGVITTFSAKGVADGDTIVCNGTLYLDAAWPGADGSRDISGITVNTGGLIQQNASTRLDINDATAITIAEGGQWRSLGTSASRCIIRGENVATAAHKIAVGPGKLYCAYTDISGFYYIGSVGYYAVMDFVNCTLTGNGYNLWATTYSGLVTLINSTVSADTASRNVFRGYNVVAINCAFTSLTNNYLFSDAYTHTLIFAGCTYQGAAIATDDFPLTTQDIDIRIYEASAVTSNVSGVSWSVSHQYMDSYGFFYNANVSLKIPGFLPFGKGNTTLFLLSWSAYWYSSLSVANRVKYFFNVSRGAAAGGLYNDQWNITASKWGYSVNSTEVWAGTAADIHLGVPATGGGGGGDYATPPGLWDINPFYTYSDGLYGTHQVNYTNGADMFAQARITWNNDIDDVLCNATLYSSPTATPLAWWNASYDFAANTTTSTNTIFGVGLSYDTSLAGNGSFYLVITFWNDTIITTSLAVQYAVLSAIPSPGLISGDTETYHDVGHTLPMVNYTWSEIAYALGFYGFNTDLANVVVNCTIVDAGWLDIMWLGEVNYNFIADATFTTTTIFGGALNIDTSLLVNGSYWIYIKLSHADITAGCAFTYTQFHVMPALIPGLEDDAFVGTYDTLGNFQVNYSWGSHILPEGEITFTYSTWATLNVTVRDGSGFDALWLANSTESYTAGVAIQITTSTGILDIDTSLLVNGSYVVCVMLSDSNFTTSYIYGGFSVNDNYTGAIHNFWLLPEDSAGLGRANFTWAEDVFLDGYVRFEGDLIGAASVNVTIYDETLAPVLWILNLSFDFGIGGGYFIPTIAGGALTFNTSVLNNETYLCELLITHEGLGAVGYISTYARINVLNMTVNAFYTNIVGGPVRYKYCAFFDWDLKQELVVNFRDRTTTDYPVQVAHYLWNFGDGSGDSTSSPRHQYAIPGIYNVTMTATFTNGDIYSYSVEVEVVDEAITFWMYVAIGMIVFIAILGVGTWAIRKQSRKLATAMFLILCGFVAVTIITLQMFMV